LFFDKVVGFPSVFIGVHRRSSAFIGVYLRLNLNRFGFAVLFWRFILKHGS